MTPPSDANPAPGSLQPADPDEARRIPIRREEIAMALTPRSQIAEQFRALRNSIQALNPDGAPRSIVLTSAVRGEGKSVATINLALALAEVPGTRVLMVDADLHAPSLEHYLGLPARAGLSELLGGRVSMDRAIRATCVPNVALLAAGELPPNSTELIGSDRMRTLLGACKQRFSYILVDTPEALTISDAALLGSACDGVLLVVRLGSTPRHMVEQAYNMLETMGGNVLGTCLTGAEIRPSKRDYADR
jgi:capsular exopolysaccharide synthesis family protein